MEKILLELARSLARVIERTEPRLLASAAMIIAAGATVGSLADRNISSFDESGSQLLLVAFGVLAVFVGLFAVLSLVPSLNERRQIAQMREAERELERLLLRTGAMPGTNRSRRAAAAQAGGAAQVASDAREVSGLTLAARVLNRSRSALQAELTRVKQASTSSLYFGIFFSFLAIGAAGYVIIFSSEDRVSLNGDMYLFLSHYLPKLSVVLLPEIIALFFLNLSIINQRDLRAIRNEITNIDLRETALTVLFSSGSKAELNKVAMQLASTERNFVLRKGERVINEADQFEKLSDQLTAALSKVGRSPARGATKKP